MRWLVLTRNVDLIRIDFRSVRFRRAAVVIVLGATAEILNEIPYGTGETC